MSLQEKYFKYKAKYTNLKNQLGGKLNQGEIDIVYELIDKDNSGSVEKQEFVDFFLNADKDKDGKITGKEFQNYLNEQLGDLFTLLDEFDGKKDGEILISEVNKFFDKIDTKKTGKFSDGELKNALEKAGITGEDRVKRLFNLFDSGSKSDSVIKKNEFNKVVNVLIKSADTNKKGSVSVDEFKRKVNSIAYDVFYALDSNKDYEIEEKELKELFNKNDVTKDGKLNKAEFTKMMKTC